MNRQWFSAAPKAAWALILLLMVIGGVVAWIGLGAGLCEDSGSSGSDAYCNGGGWEASGLAIVGLAAAALILPATGWATGNRGLFWIGLVTPPALVVAVVAVSAMLGAG